MLVASASVALRHATVLDEEDPMPPGNREPEASDADDLNSAEAAEAAAAAAEERAEAARARANELRRKLEAARPDPSEVPEGGTEAAVDDDAQIAEADEDAAADAADESEDAEPAPDATEADAVPTKRRRLRRPGVKALTAAVAVLAIIGLLSVTGYLLLQHRDAEAKRHRTAEFSAAARQGVVNLMSMDFNQAKESVQRVIDDSTGKFKSNFQDGSEDLIKAMQQAKVVTKVTVNDAAVESMDKDSATVLVAATSQRVGPDAPKEDQQPRVWRVVVSLQRDGDQLKVSDVEFA
jgi:Mce-associated membrane protein